MDYIQSAQTLIDNALEKWNVAVFENPTNLGKSELVRHLIEKFGKTLFISQSYDINRQWNDCPEIIKNTVFMTYNQFSAISPEDIYDFCSPYSLILYDEAHHAGAKSYITNIELLIGQENRKSKILGMTTHTRRYSDSADDIAYTVFEGHKVQGISFEDAIKEGLLPQFDYISALYSMPKDIDDLVAASSLARKIVSDSKLIQVNEEGIKEIVKKHMPDGDRKVVYFVPTIEDSADAEKLAKELGYGQVYAINYTKSDKENRDALKEYNNAPSASLVCISKFNEGAIPEGTNTVVILRRTATINIFERQVLTALYSAKGKPVVYDFVSNIDNLIYSHKEGDGESRGYYAERVKSLCSQSIVVDYARQWTSVFNKLRGLSKRGWTEFQDNLLRKYYPKYGNDVYRYIKGHNLKECLLRAEILGIEYVPEIKEPIKTRDASLKPYAFSATAIIKEPKFESLPDKTTRRICSVYTQILDTGRIPSDIVNKIRLDDIEDKGIIDELSEYCIGTTVISDSEPDDFVQKIRNRQNLFRNLIRDYANSKNKEATNVVILDGKALQSDSDGKDIARRIAEKELEKKQKNMILVGDRYMKKDKAVAGLYGDTVLEHMLYKYYWMLLRDSTYKEYNIKQFMKEFSTEDIVRKIEALRGSRNPWTEDELKCIRVFEKKNNTYPTLIRTHSDLDILEKTIEMGNERMANYCRSKTANFEKNFKIFISEYEKAFDVKRFEEQKKAEATRISEENRKKKEADKKRLKNLKPTVMVVSKRK